MKKPKKGTRARAKLEKRLFRESRREHKATFLRVDYEENEMSKTAEEVRRQWEKIAEAIRYGGYRGRCVTCR